MAIKIKTGGGKATPLPSVSKYEDHLSDETPVLKSPLMVGKVSVETVNNLTKSSVIVAESEEVMDTKPIPADKLWHVHVTGSRTINLGNYEAAKIVVGLTGPTTKEEINDLYEFAEAWVGEKINVATQDAKKLKGQS